jgi:hypothetical protein
LKARVWRLGRFGFEGEPGPGEESVDEGGPVLDALEPVPYDAGSWSALLAATLPRPFFMFAYTPLGGLEVRRVGRQLDYVS